MMEHVMFFYFEKKYYRNIINQAYNIVSHKAQSQFLRSGLLQANLCIFVFM